MRTYRAELPRIPFRVLQGMGPHRLQASGGQAIGGASGGPAGHTPPARAAQRTAKCAARPMNCANPARVPTHPEGRKLARLGPTQVVPAHADWFAMALKERGHGRVADIAPPPVVDHHRR